MNSFLKKTLVHELNKLGSQFRCNDIHLRKSSISDNDIDTLGFDYINEKYVLSFKEYEHIKFNIYLGYDDYFKYYCCIKLGTLDESVFYSSYQDDTLYIIKAIAELAYHICSTF